MWARTAALPPPLPRLADCRPPQPVHSPPPVLWLLRIAAVPCWPLDEAQTPAESMAARITRHSRGKTLGADLSQTPRKDALLNAVNNPGTRDDPPPSGWTAAASLGSTRRNSLSRLGKGGGLGPPLRGLGRALPPQNFQRLRPCTNMYRLALRTKASSTSTSQLVEAPRETVQSRRPMT